MQLRRTKSAPVNRRNRNNRKTKSAPVNRRNRNNRKTKSANRPRSKSRSPQIINFLLKSEPQPNQSRSRALSRLENNTIHLRIKRLDSKYNRYENPILDDAEMIMVKDIEPMSFKLDGKEEIVIMSKYFMPIYNYNNLQNKTLSIYWTDDNDQTNKMGFGNTKEFACTYNRNKTKPLRYACSTIKRAYNIKNISEELYISLEKDKLIDLTITTPEYTRDPYIYIHEGTIFGKKMNLFNMGMSELFINLLYNKNEEWAKQFKLNLPEEYNNKIKKKDDHDTDYKSIEIYQNGDPTQIITGFIYNKSKNSIIASHDDLKLQMCVHEKYYYWAVETLYRNYTKLVELGLLQFKYTYAFGMKKINSITELFPKEKDFKSVDSITEYTMHGGIYKRELQHSPNIIFYMQKDFKTYEPLIDFLCQLFNDSLPSDFTIGVPRFNMRLNNNVFFSVGGNNQYKGDLTKLTDKKIPKEFNDILNIVGNHTINKIDCDKLNEYGKIIAGIDIIEGTVPNNILSYIELIYEFDTFEEIYKKYNFSKYYVSSPLQPHINEDGSINLKTLFY